MNLLLLSLLAVAGFPGIHGQDPSTKASSSGKGSTCPDAKSWMGKYRNYSFGFSIVIPKGLKGFWNSATCVEHSDGCICMQDHGRIIPLTPEPYEPERHIEAYADNGANLDNPTVAEAVRSRLRRIREKNREKNLQIRRRSSVTVAGLQGERVVVCYYDTELKSWMMKDFIELLRKGVHYSLYLQTPEKTYDHDCAIFDSVVGSFGLQKRK